MNIVKALEAQRQNLRPGGTREQAHQVAVKTIVVGLMDVLRQHRTTMAGPDSTVYDYHRGMYNGIELSLALVEGREPAYIGQRETERRPGLCQSVDLKPMGEESMGKIVAEYLAEAEDSMASVDPGYFAGRLERIKQKLDSGSMADGARLKPDDCAILITALQKR